MRKIRRLSSLLLAGIMALSLGYYTPVAADLSGMLGVPRWTGYYTGVYNTSQSGDDVRIGGISLAGGDSTARADSLISQLTAWRSSGSMQDRVAAAFVLDTMLGRSSTGRGAGSAQAYGGGGDPYGGDIAEVSSRLTAFIAAGGVIEYDPYYTYADNTYSFNGGQDVAWYTETFAPLSAPTYVFKLNGTIYYILKQSCANPLGGLGIPFIEIKKWIIDGEARASSGGSFAGPGDTIQVAPGATVKYDYYLRNVGEIPTDQTVNWRGVDSATGGGTISGTQGPGLPPDGPWQGTGSELFTVPMDAAEGDTFCRVVGWDPISNVDSGSKTSSPPVCIAVHRDPKVTAVTVYNGGPSLSIGTKGTWNHDGTGEGFSPKPGTNGSIQTVQTVVHRTIGPTPYSGPDTVTAGPNIPSSNGGFTQSFVTDYTPVAEDVGKWVCQFIELKVSTVNGSLDRYANSKDPNKTQCVKVAKIPTMQVWGNDVRVGSGFSSGGAQESGVKGFSFAADVNGTQALRGSWAEYSVFAPTRSSKPNSVELFASGSAFNGTLPTGGSSDGWSGLTFANTPSGTLGNFTNASQMGTIPDVIGYFTTKYAGTGIKVVHGGTVNTGFQKNTVLVLNGTVNISTDIINDGPYSDAKDIGQMVIIAENGDINIHDTVSRVDAWLIAPNGKVDTCSNAPKKLAISDCVPLLTVNGPIMAREIDMRRTGGDMKTVPAELLNMRGDVYIWGRSISEQSGYWHTTNLRELPPRY